ncbi:hypothetical protein QIS99_30470 [Streptomyces sp. B-S-A8]|uniref:Uncharacterized protein n=1 Tax=Streptomyces solicavernae TaxID=3043614 RepID=A0ABT6S1B8_9ACTN|nr:hypothetical protein [Streptomyces sp. B-S-A8]MDI3390486.1 hypothetical protein [Streptomyces sp. B-S-A8]
MDHEQQDVESVDYDPATDLQRRPLLTLAEAYDVLDVLRRTAAGGGPDAAGAQRCAHVLAYRLPAQNEASAN